MTRTPLEHGWMLSWLGGPAPDAVRGLRIPATVPGAVHTDLLAAGIVPDPYLDDNEALLAWVALCDWRYETAIEWTARTDAAELVFEGIDTVATVRLNGEVIAETRNMHRSYRFDVRQLLREGANELQVDFRSAIRAANAASLELGYRTHVNHHPYNAIRKMACSFGWDWGIDTATSGLWRPAALEEWSVARLTTVRPVATVDGALGVLDVYVEVARVSDSDLELSATVGGVSASTVLKAGETHAVLQLRVLDVKKWWPRGYGDPNLYDLEVVLDAGVERLDRVAHRIGFRTVAFDTTPDDTGTPFTIVVNDVPIFVMGANWIPDDAFPHRVDRARYARRLAQAEFAHLNLLRVWGGGIYESPDFFELCDELGFLTWQDFLMACAAYAEEEPLWSEFEAEARETVTRLARHPSLVVFNGSNENLWGYNEWGWKLRLDGATWGPGYYFELFPAIVAELAPHVGYIPGSPFTPNADGRFDPDGDPNDPDHGSMHIWDLWNRKDYAHYRDYRPRFVAEFGWQAPPAWSTLTASISDDPLTPESPGMLVHQKAAEGNFKLTDGLIPHLRLPNEIEDWHWAMQLNQAKAITTATDWFRALAPHCSGSIVWQLNDCWPVTSWAAVDGAERAKPMLFALRDAHEPRRVLIQPLEPGELTVIVSNDHAEPWAGELVVERLGFDGRVLVTATFEVAADPRSNVRQVLPPEISRPGDASAELIRAQFGPARGLWFFAEYRDSALDAGQYDADLVTESTGVHRLTVMARSLIRDVTLLVDKLDPDATVDRALVTLLPGEAATFTVRSTHTPTLEDLTRRTVMRTANQLVAPTE